MSSTPTTKEEEEEKDSFRSTSTTDSSNSKRSTGVKIPVKKKEMKKKKKSITVPAAFNSVVESGSMSEQQRQAQCTSTATQNYRIAALAAAPGGEKDDIEKEEAEQKLGEDQEEYTIIHKSTIPAPGALETIGKAYASDVFPGEKDK